MFANESINWSFYLFFCKTDEETYEIRTEVQTSVIIVDVTGHCARSLFEQTYDRSIFCDDCTSDASK